MEKKESSISISSGKSHFVTRLAWISIAITSVTTFVSLIQNIILSVLFPINQMKEIFIIEPAMSRYMPELVLLMLNNIRIIFFMYLVICVTMLISSIGLLRRKNWARIIFVFILFVGIISSLAGVLFQGIIMGPVMPLLPQEYADLPGMPNFQAMFTIIRITSGILVIFIVLLYGWIIKRLASEEIKQEFIKKSLPNK